MKVTMILIVVGALGTVPKFIEKGLRELEIKGKIETIKIKSLLRSTRMIKRV